MPGRQNQFQLPGVAHFSFPGLVAGVAGLVAEKPKPICQLVLDYVLHHGTLILSLRFQFVSSR